MPDLVTKIGAVPGARFSLTGTCTIGRSARSDVRIVDPTASRQHARIRCEQGRYILEDLQGRAGTFVNGTPVSWHVLQNDDEIRIAGTTLRFEDHASDEKTELMASAEWLSDEHPICDGVDASENTLMMPRLAPEQSVLAEAHERLLTVYEISNAIGTIFDQDELISAILDAVLRVFRQTSRVVLMSRDRRTGELSQRAERVRAGVKAAKAPFSRSILKEVVENKRAVIYGGLRGLPANPGASIAGKVMSSMLCAPLLVRGEVLGVIHLTSANLAVQFERADLDLLVGIATQAAIALQNAEMHTELLARERLKHDMEVAQEIQRRFLPLAPPKIAGWCFASEYAPAHAVGGDFYDFVPVGPGRMGVLIGDVSGKGVSAALLMARVTSEFRIFAVTEREPSSVMSRVNASLVAAGYEGLFVTACYMVVDTRTRELTFCNAGHLPPLVRRAGNPAAPLQRLERSDLPLGVLDETPYEQETHILGRGDLVLLMSDGVVESTNAGGQQIGFAPVEEAIRESRGDAEATLESVIGVVKRFVDEAPQYDDLTMVAFSMDSPASTHVDAGPNSAGRSLGPK